MPALTSTAQQGPPDTRVSQRDRSTGQPTADQGKNNKSDREIMKDIRKSVLDDKSSRLNAHNVKIISQNGTVTLKGVVRSDDEKRAVRTKAEQVAGAGRVKDQLSVRPRTY
jgi:hyperosmotically inducible periplasmic protein